MSKILTVGQMDTTKSYIFKGATGTYDSTKLVKASLFEIPAVRQYYMEITNGGLDSGSECILYSHPTGSTDDLENGNYSDSWGVTASTDIIEITDYVHNQESMMAEFHNYNSSGDIEYTIKINNGWEYTEVVSPGDTVYAEILYWEDYVNDETSDTISVKVTADWSQPVTPPSPSDSVVNYIYFKNDSVNSDVNVFLVNSYTNDYKHKGYIYNNEGFFTLQIYQSELTAGYDGVAFTSIEAGYGSSSNPYWVSYETLVLRPPHPAYQEQWGNWTQEACVAGSGVFFLDNIHLYVYIDDLTSSTNSQSSPWKLDTLRVQDYSDLDIYNESSEDIVVSLSYDGGSIVSEMLIPAGSSEYFPLDEDLDVNLYEVSFDHSVNIHNYYWWDDYGDSGESYINFCSSYETLPMYELRNCSGIVLCD